MNTMLILASLLIFTLYCVYVWWKVGICKSISDSYYHIKNRVLFTLALWGFSLPVMLMASNVWIFLAGGGIVLVGAAPDFRLRLQGDVHYVAAVSGIVFGGIALVVMGLWWLTVLMGVSIVLLEYFKVKNKTWWQEVIAYYVILLGLMS